MQPFVICLLVVTIFQGSEAESIASQKCKEYGKLFQGSDIQFPDGEASSSCNKRTFSSDTHAKKGEFPYMVLLKYSSGTEFSYHCSGALISKNYVIVPAYCLNSPSTGPPVAVILGQIKFDDPSTSTQLAEGAQEIKIAELTAHPEYNRLKKQNVVGLLKLEKDVTFNKNIHPVCLEEADFGDTINVMASGWNYVSLFERTGNLLKNMMGITPLDECKKMYDNGRILLSDKQFCLGVNSTDCGIQPIGTAQLPRKDVPCMDSLVGLVSFGKGPCSGNKLPDVYTKIKSYIPWIESIVWK